MPAANNSPLVAMPQPEFRLLGNGLQVAAISRAGAGKAAISVRVAAGSHDEPEDYPGLAHFLEHLLFLGSRGFAVEDGLMAFVQSCGGQVNASTQARHTEYFCEVPAERLGEALARMLDMLANPLLDPCAQLREREVVHAEFLARSQDADTLVAVALAQALPTGHRCAAFQAGNRDTLAVEQAAFQQALLAFHRRFYQAGQLSLLLVGEQPVDQLFALARQHADVLSPGARQRQSPALPLLPLQARQLRMHLGAGGPVLHLAFALEWAQPGMAQAVEFLQAWLGSETPGGLLAGLREAGLCQGLKSEVIYNYAGQSLLLLSFAGVEPSPMAQATTMQALLAWLDFFADAELGGLHERYRKVRQCWLNTLPPLALARCWQASLALGETPISAPSPVAVAALLTQMRQASRCIQLFADSAAMPDWPAAGFALQMRREAPLVAAPRTWAWQLPPANLFMQAGTVPRSAIAMPTQLRWLPAPKGDSSGQGVLHWRCRFAERIAVAPLQALFHVALRALEADASEVGVVLKITLLADAWQLSLRGAAALLPRVLGEALPLLLEPSAEAWRQSAGQAREEAAQEATEMAFRQLLRCLPELFRAPGDCAQPTPQGLRESYRRARFEGLGVGLEAAGQSQIEQLFASVSPLAEGEPNGEPSAGRYWRDAAIRCEDSVLLLFCPQPAADAANEAGWRLLAQLYQGPFFQRLRSELQLGYAVFCGFRQVEERRGILFAVQSPQASPAQILAHIEAFLRAQGERLAALDERSLRDASGELRRQLQVANSAEFAEQRWNDHLAGLPEQHDAALQQALATITRSDLLRCQRQLSLAQGGWHVLANATQPNADWSAPY
nr:pyrroloquinoline quinone biosynthesis protein PqqF [uncultured Pseudomonas sp.]